MLVGAPESSSEATFSETEVGGPDQSAEDDGEENAEMFDC